MRSSDIHKPLSSYELIKKLINCSSHDTAITVSSDTCEYIDIQNAIFDKEIVIFVNPYNIFIRY